MLESQLVEIGKLAIQSVPMYSTSDFGTQTTIRFNTAHRRLSESAKMKAITAEVEYSAASARLWFSHDVEWIYPDQQELWEFLCESIARNRQPLILARKISPTTFSVLKAIGGLGLEYYSYLVGDDDAARVDQTREDTGWIHSVGASHALRPELQSRLRLAIQNSSAREPTSEHRARAEAAQAVGLTSKDASPEKLLQWANEQELEMPQIWFAAVERWISQGAYRRRGYTALAVDEHGSEENVTSAEASQAEDKPGIFGHGTTITRVPLPGRWWR